MAKPVTIYTTQTCVYCKGAKEFMRSKGIEFTEINVGSDQEKAREMIEKSGQMGVPVIVIGEEGPDQVIIVGFDQARLAATLGVA